MDFVKKVIGTSNEVEDFQQRPTKSNGIPVPVYRNELNTSHKSAFIPFENEAVQYWKVFFDFAFYTLLSPFRFVWDPVTGFYQYRTNKIQRTLQCILCLFTTFYFLFRVYKMSKMDPDENPTLYFEMAYYFFDTTFLVFLFLLFGRQMSLVDEVFRQLQHNNKNFYRDAVNYKKTRRICTIICIGCLGTLGLQLLETMKDQDWSFVGFMQFWQEDAAEVFHYRAMTDEAPTFFALLAMTSSLFEKLLNAFSDILFTMTVLMFDTLVNSFEADMNKVGTFQDFESPTRVLEHYWWLKYITEKINSAMGLIIGAFIAGNLPFYATNVFEVFGDGNIFMRLRYMCYCSYWFPSLFIAANANRKLEEVKDWICKEENYAKIPPVKLSVFLHEVNFRTVGICSFGILTVTWNSVGSIISIILTYALLKSQFKQVGGTSKSDGMNGTDIFSSNLTGIVFEENFNFTFYNTTNN